MTNFIAHLDLRHFQPHTPSHFLHHFQTLLISIEGQTICMSLFNTLLLLRGKICFLFLQGLGHNEYLKNYANKEIEASLSNDCKTAKKATDWLHESSPLYLKCDLRAQYECSFDSGMNDVDMVHWQYKGKYGNTKEHDVMYLTSLFHRVSLWISLEYFKSLEFSSNNKQ